MAQQPQPTLNDPAPIDPATVANPYLRFQQLREEDPVHWNQGINSWTLTRYSDVLDALRDQRLSSEQISAYSARLPEAAAEKVQPLIRLFSDMMLMSDPPDHTRLRKLANKAFTPRVVDQMRSHIQNLVAELLDGIEKDCRQDGRFDVIADLAYPLPAIVISEMLGVPDADRNQFRKWAGDLAAFLGNIRIVAETAEPAQKSALKLSDYLREIISQRRLEPQEDLISALVAAEEEGDTFSEAELHSMCIMLMLAGHETTSNLIGNGLLALLQNRDQLERLQADPGMIDSAVEEFLRYESPAQSAARIALEDIEMGGRRIEKGQRVTLILAAANRDPERFSDPDRLDITREDNRHLSFGFGSHFCLGTDLARLEGQISINAVVQRWPDLRMASNEPEWRYNPTFRGLISLPVTF
jgi:cytochrome P450